MKKLEIGFLRGLIDRGYSIITIGNNKIPNFEWKKYQTEQIEKDTFETNYNASTTHGQGIVTGYNNLEVIDVDLKVFNTSKQQQDFWSEYYAMLCDNIDDFDNKFVIYKTINNGYHILYRCETFEGNKKIACLENNKCVIETRGKGGYVFIYENKVSELSYYDIKEISVQDREILLSVSRCFDRRTKELKTNEQSKTNLEGLKPGEDYNQRNTIWDVISDEFTIVRRLSDRIIIKRNGAESAHSGYIFTETNRMYLFTTSTCYPSETLLNPFACYAFKYHNGDYSQASKVLYKENYGDRAIKETPINLKEEVENINIEFPLDIFPIEFQNYLIESSEKLNLSIDYMASSLLWMYSVIIGNSLVIEAKKGWTEPCNLWIALVGDAGIGKTPSVSHIIKPLEELNRKEQKIYAKKKQAFDEWCQLTKEERKQTEEVQEPINKQFIVGDITIEALVSLHEANPNSIGIFKDELAGWFKDMNKYRAGSDIEFWLSSWSNKSYALNRKTSNNAFVDKPFIPVLGGIQPAILEDFSNGSNKENGFMDRVLIVYPELKVNEFSINEMNNSHIEWFNNTIQVLHTEWQRYMISFDDNGYQYQKVAVMNDEAKQEYIKAFNQITAIQNGDSESEYIKSIYPKQKSYILRFALILNTIYRNFDNNDLTIVDAKSIINAKRLSDYFVLNAKKIKINAKETKSLLEPKSDYEKFKEMYIKNPKLNKQKTAKFLGVSRVTVDNYIKRYNNETK